MERNIDMNTYQYLDLGYFSARTTADLIDKASESDAILIGEFKKWQPRI